MTNINCTSNCIHQKDGKCQLNNVTAVSSNFDYSCIYFEERDKKKAKKEE